MKPTLTLLTALLLAPLAASHGADPAFRLDSKSRWTIEYCGPTKPEVLRFAAEQLDAHLSRMLGEPARSALAERNWADVGYHVRLVTGGKTPPVAGAPFWADFLAASPFLGFLPPVDFLAVCLVRAMERRYGKERADA